MPTNQEVAEALVKKFGDSVFDFQEPYGFLTLTTTREQVLPLLEYLRDHEQYKMSFLTDITAVHFPESAGHEFCVVYHVHSMENNFRSRVKVFIPENDVNIPSATSLWPSANWMERETYDYFGINFENHPNLKRILNMDDMDYFPMRKEFPLEDPTREDKVDALFGR